VARIAGVRLQVGHGGRLRIDHAELGCLRADTAAGLERTDCRLGRFVLRDQCVHSRGLAADLRAQSQQRNLHCDDAQQRDRDDRDPQAPADQTVEPGVVDDPKERARAGRRARDGGSRMAVGT
jgi:hypothetical protein